MLLLVPPVLLALTVHECAHAWTAWRLGDPTAKTLGRVTLNPIRHLDLFGTLVLFLTGLFGWAKPVPINPVNFTDVRRGILWVSLAGPLSNLFLAGVFAVAYKLLQAGGGPFMASAPALAKPVFIMVELSVVLNISLAVFNMLPVPPLDGSKVLSMLLPFRKALAFSRLEPYGFIILILLIMTGIISKFVSPVVFLLVGLLTGGRY